MASYEMNLTEIYNSDVYNNNKNTSETLEVSQISQVTMPVFLRAHGYNVMCENNLNAEKLAEVKPMILYTCIDGGKSLNFNCVVDWDAFIDSGYTSITLTKRGVVADTGMNLLIKDIWHAVGLKEDLANYGANFFDSLAEDVQNEMLSRFLEMGVNYLQNIGGTEYNWASNTEFIPYLDVEDGEVKAKFYVPSQFYESIYDYIYDTYAVSGEIEYELHTASSTGTYTLTSPMRLTKDLFRKAFLNLAKANTINTHKYDWYLPDADDIYDTYLKPILDLNHYDTIYDYVNIMFKSGEDSLELSQCGEQAPTHVQIQFYNIQDNEISITNVKTHTDDAVIKYTGNTYVQVVDIL